MKKSLLLLREDLEELAEKGMLLAGFYLHFYYSMVMGEVRKDDQSDQFRFWLKKALRDVRQPFRKRYISGIIEEA